MCVEQANEYLMLSNASAPTYTQEKPTKQRRSRAPKACGECRRLKLKCDRVFPCQSCVKRGCEGICPEGSLVSGRGSRYILANTEQLHEKIVRMADRIRELEDALRVVSEAHAQCLNLPSSSSDPPHPLLRDDLLLIKNQIELYNLAARLDPYTSDGSDADHLGLSAEGQSSTEGFGVQYASSSTHIMEPQGQGGRYMGPDSFGMEPRPSSSVHVTAPQWTSDPLTFNQYQLAMHVHSAAPVDYQHAGNHHDGSLPACHTYEDPNASQALDECHYLATYPIAQNENAYFFPNPR